MTENRNKHDYSLVYNPELSYLYIEANKVMVVWEGKEDQPVTDGTITIPSLEAGHKVVVKDTSLITESKTTIADIKAIDATAIIKKGDTEIAKVGYELKKDYILLKQLGITMENLKFDAKIAAYIQ